MMKKKYFHKQRNVFVFCASIIKTFARKKMQKNFTFVVDVLMILASI